MKVFRLFAMGLAAVLLLPGCAGKVQVPDPVTIAVDMNEFTFNLQNYEWKVGQQVTLDLTNSGQLPHEVMIGRDVMVMGGQPSGYENDLFLNSKVVPDVKMIERGHDAQGMDMHSNNHSGLMTVVNPGGHSRMTFIVTPEMVGKWEMGCFQQEGVHYTTGMKSLITISQ